MKFSRLFPLVASISTLALVAACARHEKSAKISPETMELQAAKSLRETYGNVNLYDAKNLAFAKLVDGADLVLNREVGKDFKTNSRSVDVDVSILMKDRDEAIVATGVVSHGGPSVLELKTEDAHYSMTAQCVHKDCANLIVELSKLEEQTATQAAVPMENAQLGAGQAQLESKSELKSAEGDTSQGSTDAQSQADITKDSPAVSATTAAPTKAIAATAKAYLQFRVPMKDAKLKETDSAKLSRLATFNLFWSSPTELGKPTSGATASVSEALKARNGKKVSDTTKDETQNGDVNSETKTETDTKAEVKPQTQAQGQAQDGVKPADANAGASTAPKADDQAQTKADDKKAEAPKADQQEPEIVVTATLAQVAKSQADYAKELAAKAAKEKDAKEKQKILAEAKSWNDKAAVTQAKADAKAKAEAKVKADAKAKADADAKAKADAEKAKKKA